MKDKTILMAQISVLHLIHSEPATGGSTDNEGLHVAQ